MLLHTNDIDISSVNDYINFFEDIMFRKQLNSNVLKICVQICNSLTTKTIIRHCVEQQNSEALANSIARFQHRINVLDT